MTTGRLHTEGSMNRFRQQAQLYSTKYTMAKRDTFYPQPV